MGRPFIFKSPEQVYKAFNDYLEWCKENTIGKQEMIKSGALAGTVATIDIPRVPTILGFCVFSHIAEKTFYNYINDCNDEDLLQSFIYVRDYFRQEMTDSAVAGVANPAIAAMLLGLRQKSEVETISIDASNKSEDEIRAAIKAIEASRKPKE